MDDRPINGALVKLALAPWGSKRLYLSSDTTLVLELLLQGLGGWSLAGAHCFGGTACGCSIQ